MLYNRETIVTVYHKYHNESQADWPMLHDYGTLNRHNLSLYTPHKWAQSHRWAIRMGSHWLQLPPVNWDFTTQHPPLNQFAGLCRFTRKIFLHHKNPWSSAGDRDRRQSLHTISSSLCTNEAFKLKRNSSNTSSTQSLHTISTYSVPIKLLN